MCRAPVTFGSGIITACGGFGPPPAGTSCFAPVRGEVSGGSA